LLAINNKGFISPEGELVSHHKRDPCPGGLEDRGTGGVDRQEKRKRCSPKATAYTDLVFVYTLKYMYSELLLTLSLQSLYVP